MGGSVLKNLKADLQKNNLLGHQKQRKGNPQDAKLRRDRDEQSLNAIRDAFNPFNSKFDKQKESGRPVKARSIAEKQRKEIWDAEKRLKNKIGGLVDRRFGEKNSSLSEQDKMVERFAREKLNSLRRGNKKSFNIEDSENDNLLTHGGEVLTFQDDFQENDLGLEEESEKQEYYDTHNRFSRSEDAEGQDLESRSEATPRQKTKAEVMQEVIAKSKMHKFERQQQQQKDDDLVEELNAGFDDLMTELVSVEVNAKKERRTADSYDINVQELAYDKRADPQDRKKTDQEIETEAEEKRLAAERAKVARMEGDELDIDLDYEDAKDDAHIFGLEGSEDESDTQSQDSNDEGEEEDSNSSASLINVPQSYGELRKISIGSDISILRSFIKQVTPGQGKGSKTKLHKLCGALVDYAIRTPQLFAEISSILHDAAPNNETGIYLATHIRELVHKAKLKAVWSQQEILLFSIVGNLFSTSDQWHVVATSASVVITQRLSSSIDIDSIKQNLCLCDLLLVYQRISKRYIPEVPGYLLRVLAMMNPDNKRIAERFVRLSPHSMPIDEVTSVNGDIALSENFTPSQLCWLLIRVIDKSSSLWRSLEAFNEIFSALRNCLLNLPYDRDDDHSIVSQTVEKLEKLLHFSVSERKPLELQQFRPIGIQTLAPMFDENYNPDVKGAGMDPEKRELQKLKALHKKERKSTLREIRRDAEFESRQRLNDKRSEMKEYHNKLKRLEGQINGDEGAAKNAYEREKKKRRHR